MTGREKAALQLRDAFRDDERLPCNRWLHAADNKRLHQNRKVQSFLQPKGGLHPAVAIRGQPRVALHPGVAIQHNPGLYCIRGLHSEDNRGLYCIRGLHVRHMKHMKFGSMRLLRNQVTLRSLILASWESLRDLGLRGYLGLPPKPAWGPVPRPPLRFAAV